MKRHLNTLFVTTPDTWLAKQGECVELHRDGERLGTIPLHTLQSIACFGRVSCSPYLLEHCAALGVTVSWFSESGRFMASVQGPTRGNVLLRRAQYRAADDPRQSAALARSFLIGKVANSRTILMRQARSTPAPALSSSVAALGRSLGQLRHEDDADVLRGLEGDAARTYFETLDHLIRPQCRAAGMSFEKRSRRPPLNEVNCLLSFLYTLLAHDIRSALESVGLDPAVGFLHRERPGRASLALDMMEEFRPYLADRLALSLINRQQLTVKDFLREDGGAVTMKEKSRKKVIIAWQDRKKEEIVHPFLNERMAAGLVFFIQARLLARVLRHDLDAYPPFVVR